MSGYTPFEKNTIFPKSHWATYWKVYRIASLLRHISWNYEEEKPIKGFWYDTWRVVNYEILDGDNRTPEYVSTFKLSNNHADFLNKIYKKMLTEITRESIDGQETN